MNRSIPRKMVCGTLLTLSSLGNLQHAVAAPTNPQPLAGIDEFIVAVMEEFLIPGLAVGADGAVSGVMISLEPNIPEILFQRTFQ